jgi:GLPGLI family protein
MKTLLTKISGITLLLFFTLNLNAQDFQGRAIYQAKTSLDMSSWGNGQMSEQQKKQIADRMKSMLEKTYQLVFDRNEASFKENEKLQAPGSGGGRWGGMMSSFAGGPQYKNIKEKLIIQEQDFFGKIFLIKDSLPQLEWKLLGESKQIGQYTCFKAIATKQNDELDFMSMRRRNREDDNKKEDEKKDGEALTDTTNTNSTTTIDDFEIPKVVEVTAWYTPQIPVSTGPGEYHGLPGLILEVTAGRTIMLCTKITMNPQDRAEIIRPEKGKVVNRKEYNDIVKEKMQEMRDMYGGRGRDGGRRH